MGVFHVFLNCTNGTNRAKPYIFLNILYSHGFSHPCIVCVFYIYKEAHLEPYQISTILFLWQGPKWNSDMFSVLWYTLNNKYFSRKSDQIRKSAVLHTDSHCTTYKDLWHVRAYPVDTWCKLNVHKMFNLCFVSAGY